MKNIYKIILICLLSSAFCNMTIYAQEIEWQNTIGGNGTDELYSIMQTADGGYILGGSSGSGFSGDKSDSAIGGGDYWIVKTDSLGNILWQNTIGGTGLDHLLSTQLTTDGGYILGGFSGSNISGDKAENCIGDFDYWILKIDSVGNIQWQNTIGGNGSDILCSVRQTQDGGYILGGYSNSQISGDKTENWIGDDDYWIVKTNSLGIILWQNTIGGTGIDYFSSILQTYDGGYILGGYSNSGISGDKTENWIGYEDCWIIKTDSVGNIIWQNTIGGSGPDYLFSLEQTFDGGFILGVYSSSDISGDKTQNCKGGADYWIVKTDSAGNIQWQNTIGGNTMDQIGSIRQTNDGGYILGGTSRSGISGNKTEENMDPLCNPFCTLDYWIVKTNMWGNIEWQNTIGGIAYDNLLSVQQTSDGEYILGGYSKSNLSGDKTENSFGDYDYWIIKLTDKYSLITGNCFIDINSNNLPDSGEVYLNGNRINESNTGRFAFSNQVGNYSIAVLDTGNFSVSPITINYYNALPVAHNIYFPGIQQNDSSNNFAFQPQGIFVDLCVTLTPLNAFRAGFNASYIISYGNVGTTTISPTVIFFPDSSLNFVSANPNASSVTTDSVVWNLGPLAPFQTGSILVEVNVKTGTPIGTVIQSFARIEPVAGDANPNCNYSNWRLLTTGSFDPNDILVDEDTLTTVQISTQPFLEYIIRFQNTGNDTAFTVKILNPIDTNKLQLNTLEFVSSSHTVSLNWIPWERNMEFKFENILLPDSNVNEPMSHGFVRYRIKPKTSLFAPDSVINNAYIYFDFNEPVATNIASTSIILPTSIFNTEHSTFNIQIAPNPASELFIIELPIKLNSEINIQLYSMEGKEVFNETRNASTSINIDSSNLSTGLYLIKIVQGNSIYFGKVSIMN